MKRFTVTAAIIVLGVVLMGCGTAAKTVALKSQSERTGVFQEITGAEAVPAGYADVVIKASIKTHVEGYYIAASRESAHGKSTYPFLVNIDGQAVQWNAEGKIHQLPNYIDGKASRDPEAGDGMKYSIEKKVRLAVGSHKVFFGLPEDAYFTVAELSVLDEGAYVLEFKPEYKYKLQPTRIPTYLKGIRSFHVALQQAK